MLPEFMLPELNLTETAVTVVNAWISAHPSYVLEVVFSCLNQKNAYDYLVEQATGYAWLNEGVVKKIVQKIGCCQRLISALYIRLASDDLDPAYREEFERIKNWLVFEYTPPYLYTLYHVWNNQTTYRPATFWPRAPRISQINRLIGDCVFGPFPEVAHPLHEKSAKDSALCKRDKKRTGNLSISGFFWHCTSPMIPCLHLKLGVWVSLFYWSIVKQSSIVESQGYRYAT